MKTTYFAWSTTENINRVGRVSVQSWEERFVWNGSRDFQKKEFCMGGGKKAQRRRQNCEALEGVVLVLSDRNVFIVLLFYFSLKKNKKTNNLSTCVIGFQSITQGCVGSWPALCVGWA